MMLARNRRAGFTLVEQMVAIASVAVVAAIVTPMVIGQINKAEVRRIHSDVQGIEKGTQRFRTETGAWPGAIQDLVDIPSDTDGDTDLFGASYASSVADVWQGPYFEPKHMTSTGGVVSAAGAEFVDRFELATWNNKTFLVILIDGVAFGDAQDIRAQFEGQTEVQGTTTDVLTDDTLGRVRWDSTLCGPSTATTDPTTSETTQTDCTDKTKGTLYYLVPIE